MSLTLTRPTRHPTDRHRRSRGPAVLLITLVAAAGVLFTVSQLAAARRDLLLARSNLAAAREAISRRDDDGGRSELDAAARNLASAKSHATTGPLPLLRLVPLIGSPVRAIGAAADAGNTGVAAGRVLLDASSSFPTSASATVDGRDLSAFHSAAVRSVRAVNEAEAYLDEAVQALDGPSSAVLPPVSGPARAMRAEVTRSRAELAGVGRGLALLENLSSPGTTSRILVLAQDSLELRPTGGYIGSYGVLEFDHGTAKLASYAATEDLPPPDPPLKPPQGLAGYLPSFWGLSNVNWWPDFPTTAAAATEMFRRQGGGAVDGVLALTEAAIARLVGVLGPLRLPSYPQPVVEQDFDQRVVHEVELKRPADKPRKKFLIELSEALFDRLFQLPADRLPAVTDALRKSIGAGDIQLWLKDPERQARLAGMAVSGALPKTDGDFLMVVDANLGASKANLNLTKNISYRVDRDRDGRRVGHVRIELRNDGPKTDINPFYSSYLRVYAPAGSELIGPTPLQAQQPAADGPYVVFIQPIIVYPREQGLVTFDYRLPERLAHGAYRLTWLRQPGTGDDRLTATVGRHRAEADPRVKTLRVGSPAA